MTDGIPLAPQARSMAQATATSIVVGLLLAHLEETAPGTTATIRERLNAVLAHAESRATMDAATLEEVSSHARGLLSTRNI